MGVATDLGRISVHWANHDGRSVKCHLTHAMSFANNTTYLRIPRSCLGLPRWVRVHLETLTDTVYSDDAHTDQAAGIPTHFMRRDLAQLTTPRLAGLTPPDGRNDPTVAISRMLGRRGTVV